MTVKLTGVLLTKSGALQTAVKIQIHKTSEEKKKIKKRQKFNKKYSISFSLFLIAGLEVLFLLNNKGQAKQ